MSYADDQPDGEDHGQGGDRWGVVSKVHDVIRRLTKLTLSVPEQVAIMLLACLSFSLFLNIFDVSAPFHLTLSLSEMKYLFLSHLLLLNLKGQNFRNLLNPPPPLDVSFLS